MLNGVAFDALSGTIPESLFVIFQMTFAIITVAIISGSIADRMKYSAFMAFIAVWVILVYAPITHWVWAADGWLFKAGALDFAGGTVVHINAGVAGLVAAYMLGKRTGLGRESMAPHNLTLTVIGASLIWVGWFGFNGGSALGAGAYVGDLGKAMLNGVAFDALSGTIPESLFVIFQMTFAIITVAIISGSIADRMKYSAFMAFIAVWVILVYAPITHWVWAADGWLFKAGALDFAGGTVVHINAGVAGLVAAYMLGKRTGLGRESMAPHNLTLTVIGASLIWVGWFGFNGGSALGAGARASMAILVTQVAAAAAAFSWLIVERLVRGKASVLGGASGAVAGLVVITPAAGFVGVGGALIMGLIGGVVCFWGITALKRLLKADDALDAFGLHAVGGIVGAILTGVFYSDEIIKAANVALAPTFIGQLWVQIEGVLATIAYSAIVTFIILKVIVANTPSICTHN